MLWTECLKRLEMQISDSEISTWLLPLHAREKSHGLYLLAPNTLVLQEVHKQYIPLIVEHARNLSGNHEYDVILQIGTEVAASKPNKNVSPAKDQDIPTTEAKKQPNKITTTNKFTNTLNNKMAFNNFVEGKSNQLARAAAMQVGDNPGDSYNPLFIYGGVGLGKTHLMHAVGNNILSNNPSANVVYLHSEAFVNDMISAIRTNRMDLFKQHYRSVDALLIDDIQFFAGKERSMEEFFHTFNALLEGQKQIILTSDRYPRDVEGLDDRLKSRFSWGLSVAIESPDLETRVAILRKKGEEAGLLLPNDVAFFIAQRFKSNIRDLEGALRKLIATVNFRNQTDISLDFVQDALRDQLASQDKMVTIPNIKKTVSEYYNIRVSDLESKSRARAVTRPRQLAMYLSKELTQHSLPDIGKYFGNRDHTTVLHACKTMQDL
ncbi:MAG TPA: chromosomal replication initiator protein DnaA, partial [Thiothrix sp.]|nr:chromosomal replication initiator protein DnaA [Thiothrix sp.]